MPTAGLETGVCLTGRGDAEDGLEDGFAAGTTTGVWTEPGEGLFEETYELPVKGNGELEATATAGG